MLRCVFQCSLESEVSTCVCWWFLQVLEKLESLHAERDRLEEQWNRKQSWLESVHLEQIFYRDVNSMDKMSSSQEVHTHSLCLLPRRHKNITLIVSSVLPSLQILLQNGTLGDTVDETEGLIKRHEAFEKLLSSQEDKVGSAPTKQVFNLRSNDRIWDCF